MSWYRVSCLLFIQLVFYLCYSGDSTDERCRKASIGEAAAGMEYVALPKLIAKGLERIPMECSLVISARYRPFIEPAYKILCALSIMGVFMLGWGALMITFVLAPLLAMVSMVLGFLTLRETVIRLIEGSFIWIGPVTVIFLLSYSVNVTIACGLHDLYWHLLSTVLCGYAVYSVIDEEI